MCGTDMSTGATESVGNSGAPVRVVAGDEVRAYLREHGRRLYVWTSSHWECQHRITTLEADTDRPPYRDARFEHVYSGDFDVFLDMGSRRQPEMLKLALKGRHRKITAYWNGEGAVR